jgi:hypothetical protein
MSGGLDRLALFACVLIAALLGSCKPPPPQIMLRIETDIPQGAGQVLEAIRIELISPRSGINFHRSQVVIGERRLPGDFAINWGGRDPILDLRVTAQQRDAADRDDGFRDLFTVRAVATFPRNDAVTLWVFLANRCLIAENRNCPQGFTCGRSGCEPETRGELRPTREDAGPPEVSIVSALDASVAMDATPEASRCPPGLIVCGGNCVDPRSNPSHCGGCGQACTGMAGVATASCSAGVCRIDQCERGLGNCDGEVVNGCETSLTTATNCGACRTACRGATPVCDATMATAQCASGCPAGATRCGNACIDVRTSLQHCGACDNMCPDRPNFTRVCAAGVCGGTCSAGFADCDMSITNGCEVDTSSSVSHCGGCGMACASRPNTAVTCAGSACAYECSPGFGDCDGDPMNGCETNTNSSLGNCGGCGRLCRPNANQSATCAAGMCTRSCLPGYLDCDMGAANGCEASSSAATSCGACGVLCSGATPSCSAGMCSSGCAAGQSNCGMGMCVDTMSSTMSCGACGSVCAAAPNATPTCSAGACGLMCFAGYGNCNMTNADGCEADLMSDLMHCGRCASSCPPRANATASCSRGACGFACFGGFEDCNRLEADGCEADLGSSNLHCGMCGNRCSGTVPNGVSSCVSGACELVCNSGYEDVDRNPANGCEALTCPDRGNLCTSPPTDPCRIYSTQCTAPNVGECRPNGSNWTNGLFFLVPGMGAGGQCMTGTCVPSGSDAGVDGGCPDAGSSCDPSDDCMFGVVMCAGDGSSSCVASTPRPSGAMCTLPGGFSGLCNGMGACIVSPMDGGIDGSIEDGGAVLEDGVSRRLDGSR